MVNLYCQELNSYFKRPFNLNFVLMDWPLNLGIEGSIDVTITKPRAMQRLRNLPQKLVNYFEFMLVRVFKTYFKQFVII